MCVSRDGRPQIYWKAARLSSDSPVNCGSGVLFPAPDSLGCASEVSSWVTVNTDYELSFDQMDHRSSPSHIILENITFGRDGKTRHSGGEKVDIGLSSRQITDPLHVDTITLYDGTLNLSPQTAPLPFQADRFAVKQHGL